MLSQIPSVVPPGVDAVVLCQPPYRPYSLWRGLTLLQQNYTGKPIIQIPEVNTADATFVVQLPVNIEGLVRLDLHLPDPLTRDRPFTRALISTGTGTAHAPIHGRIKLVAPWASVAIPVAVVVAQEVLAPRVLAALDGQGLVDRGEEIFGQVRREGDDGVEVGSGLFGVEAAEEVPGGDVSAIGQVAIEEEGGDVQCRIEGVDGHGGRFVSVELECMRSRLKGRARCRKVVMDGGVSSDDRGSRPHTSWIGLSARFQLPGLGLALWRLRR